MRDELLKIIADLKEMRKLEAAGIMVMANSDDTMFEDCLRRLNELSAQRAEAGAPEVRLNQDKTLDEVVSRYCHLEQMDYNHWFLDAGGVVVWLHAKGKINATYEYRRTDMNKQP